MYKGKSLRRASKHWNIRNTCHVHRDLSFVQGFADFCLYTGTCFSKLPLHILSLQTALFKEWNLCKTTFLPFCRQPEVEGDMDYHNCSFMEEVSSSLCKGGEASGNQRVEKMKGSIYREGGVPWCLQGLWASLAFKILRLLDLGRVCLSQRTSGDFHMGLFCFLQVSTVLSCSQTSIMRIYLQWPKEVILKTGMSEHDLLYFPDEDTEAT